MEDIKFRNHFSVVFEKLIGLFIVIALIILRNVDDFVGIIRDLREAKVALLNWQELLVLLGVVLIFALVLLFNAIIWSKTWITITRSTIVLERNTLNKVCNTIGMKNISNVNLEQNFWEKILGTCKLKLDTNSLSTADSTDIEIVLKHAKACEMQQIILDRVNAAQGRKTAEDAGPVLDDRRFDVQADQKDIALHGLCSVNLGVLLFMLGCIGGSVTAFTAFRDSFEEGLVPILANLVIIAGVVISCLKSLLGGFITYHNFKVGRRGDKILVHYGLFRTFDYTIPVNKINAVVIKQTLIGRLLKKYMVELVNVGMGDEDEEAGAFIILACDRAQLQKHLELLLPEFASVPLDRVQRQPKAVLWNKVVKALIWSAVLGCVAAGFRTALPFIPLWWVLLPTALLIAFGILLAVLDYRTAGAYLDAERLLVVNGCFGRRITVMTYDKVQYLELHTNPVLRHFGLVRGCANLLAAAGNQVQNIPVCRERAMEPFLQRFVKGKLKGKETNTCR